MGVAITLMSMMAFGPPYSPFVITLSSLVMMLFMKHLFGLPGLINDIEHITVTCMFGGLPVEYLINGKMYGHEI
jgi:hypothetical protein